MDQPIPIPGEIPAEIPKPELEEPKTKMNVWVKSAFSLVLYLAIGYFFFSSNWIFLLIITLIIVFHELGHFIAMKFFNYNDLGIFFIPLLGAYVSGNKQEVSQRQSAIILLAGPVPGIIVGIILLLIPGNASMMLSEAISLDEVAKASILLNLLNLLPIYPLDGGQLLHRLFLDNSQIIGRIFLIASAALLTWVAISSGIYPLLIFPFMMITRLIRETQHERIEKKIEAEGIDLVKTYEEISPEEYWKIRNVLIRHYPQLRDVKPSPPYEISSKEDQVITIIQGLLQRNVIQDLSLGGKFLIMLIWIGCFAVPFFLDLSIGGLF
jgi:stage IV sporulation protein FB